MEPVVVLGSWSRNLEEWCMTNTDCTILVCSCDKYADLLDPFAVLWQKYWPDCPFETVLVTETKPDQELCFNRVVACGKGGN